MKAGLLRAQLAACTALVGIAFAPQARAQLLLRYLPQSVPGYQLDPTLQVLQNGGPDYRNPGIRVGSFIIHPNVDESFAYNTNPLGFSEPRGSPEIDTGANVSINSDWSRDSIGASASVDDQRYTALPVANQTNYDVFGGGRLDIGRDSLDVSAGYIRNNLGPTDVLTRGLTTPVPYRTFDARIAYSAVLNRWTVVPEIDLTTYRFGTASAGSSFIDDTTLDKNQVAGGLTAKYELSPGRDLVAALQETAAFVLNRPAGQPANRYFDTLALVGLSYDTFAAFRYDILLGWEVREWTGQVQPARQTPSVEASVTWKPTLLTTVNVAAIRHLSDASYDVTNDLAYSEGKITAFHELYRNIIVQGDLDLQATDGDQEGGGRLTISSGVGARWLLNPRLRADLFYNYSHGTSSGSQPGTGPAYNTSFFNNGAYSSNSIQLSINIGY